MLVIMGISYELERQPLRMYLKTLKSIEASEIAMKLNAKLSALENLQAVEALEAKCSLVTFSAITTAIDFCFPLNCFLMTIVNYSPLLVNLPFSGASHWT